MRGPLGLTILAGIWAAASGAQPQTAPFDDGSAYIFAKAGPPTQLPIVESFNSISNPDALDSVQMDDAAFVSSMESGVLYSCVVPGSGNIIGVLLVRRWRYIFISFFCHG